MDIPGKVVIVTGAGSGIGEAVSLELVRRGVKAIGLIDQTDCAAQLAGSINQFTHQRVQAVACVGDVTDENFRRQVFDELQAKWGIVQILVPAAGITRDSLAAKIDKTTGKVRALPGRRVPPRGGNQSHGADLFGAGNARPHRRGPSGPRDEAMARG